MAQAEPWAGEQAAIDRTVAIADGGAAEAKPDPSSPPPLPEAASVPVTAVRLYDDLVSLGVAPGMTVIVHSSLSRLGWVCGGAPAVVHALQAALGLRPPPTPNTVVSCALGLDLDAAPAPRPWVPPIAGAGTLVMPAHSGDNSEPKYWCAPPVPLHWQSVVRRHLTPFDPYASPTRGMGAIAESFRTYRAQPPAADATATRVHAAATADAGAGGLASAAVYEVLRSWHPAVSFCAQGPNAVAVTASHSLAFGMAERTPIAAVYALPDATAKLATDNGTATATVATVSDQKTAPPGAAVAATDMGGGWVLLLGDVTHAHNSSLHLAEHRAQWYGKRTHRQAAAVLDPHTGAPQWVAYDEYDYDEDFDADFEAVGLAFERAYAGDARVVRRARVGLAGAVLMRQRALVDFATKWMAVHRTEANAMLRRLPSDWPEAVRALVGAYIG